MLFRGTQVALPKQRSPRNKHKTGHLLSEFAPAFCTERAQMLATVCRAQNYSIRGSLET